MDKNNVESENKPKKSTIKILDERDKKILSDTPPNFKSTFFIRTHNNKNGFLLEKD